MKSSFCIARNCGRPYDMDAPEARTGLRSFWQRHCPQCRTKGNAGSPAIVEQLEPVPVRHIGFTGTFGANGSLVYDDILSWLGFAFETGRLQSREHQRKLYAAGDSDGDYGMREAEKLMTHAELRYVMSGFDNGCQ